MKKQKVEEEEKIDSDTHVPELGCKPQWDVDSSDDEEYEKYRRERRRAFDSKVILIVLFSCQIQKKKKRFIHFLKKKN